MGRKTLAKRYRQGCLTISLGHDSATISPTEGLKVEGHASGPAVKEFFDCSDYEYGLSVDTEQINILLLALLHEFLAGVHAFSKIKDFCKRYGVMFIEEKASVKSSEHGFRTISLGDDSATISPTEGLKVWGGDSGEYGYGLSVDLKQINLLVMALINEFCTGVHAFSGLMDLCEKHGVKFKKESWLGW